MAKILEIRRNSNSEDATPISIRVAIEDLLGFSVSAYDEEMPDGYDWGRIYKVKNEIAAIELVKKDNNLHYIMVNNKFQNLKHWCNNINNLIFVDSFNFSETDKLVNY